MALGVRTQAELSDLIKFFQVARGKGHYFRYKDWVDYKSCDAEATATNIDQNIGTGDSSDGTNGTQDYQLKKVYTLGGAIINERNITRPVNSTILIAVDGVAKTESTHYNIDYDTGIVTFTAGNRPLTGEAVTWGGEFDVPCRFDTDELEISLDFFEHGSASIPVVEVRE